MPALLALLLIIASAVPTSAAERTFVLSPADLARSVDEFNGEVLAHSASFGRRVGIRGNAVRFFGRNCPTLGGDSGLGASRVRVLDGAARAAVLAGRTPNLALGSALAALGAVTWKPPGVARTRQQAWIVEPAVTGAVGFATEGFSSGDPRGNIDVTAAGDVTLGFLVHVDLTADVGSDPAALVLAVTTEAPASRPGRMPRRSECFLVAHTAPADVRALVDLLAATPLSDDTRGRLSHILDDALDWIAHDRPLRAARATKRFAVEVASRSASEIPADAAAAMIARALLVTDALGL